MQEENHGLEAIIFERIFIEQCLQDVESKATMEIYIVNKWHVEMRVNIEYFPFSGVLYIYGNDT